MLYKMTITHNGHKGLLGELRTDGQYKMWNGMTIDFNDELDLNDCAWFDYVKDNNGENLSGRMHTSIVLATEHFGRDIILHTLNSTYYLKAVNVWD